MSKKVLITGANTGFGREISETMSTAGYTVIAAMRDLTGHNLLQAEIIQQKGIQVIELDVTSQESVANAIEEVKNTAGGLDILINNAELASAGVTEAFTDEQATSLFDVNVIGLHRVTRAVLPIFRQQKDGLIINIGSILGRVTFPFFGLYGASKFAVEAMTESLRYEVSQLGVDVVLIQPSAYPSTLYANCHQPADLDCVSEYGDIGKIPKAMFSYFMGMYESDSSPNQHEVAQAILKLAYTPKGDRPIRTVVGTSYGADLLNEITAPVQSEAVDDLGLSHLQLIRL